MNRKNMRKGIAFSVLFLLVFSMMSVFVMSSPTTVVEPTQPPNGDLGVPTITSQDATLEDDSTRTVVQANYDLRTAYTKEDEDRRAAAEAAAASAAQAVSDAETAHFESDGAREDAIKAAFEKQTAADKRLAATPSAPEPLGTLTREVGTLGGTFTTTKGTTLEIKATPSLFGRNVEIVNPETGSTLSDKQLQAMGYTPAQVARIRELVDDAVANDGDDAEKYSDANDGALPPQTVARNNAILSKYMGATRGRLSAIFSSYLDSWLGPFTMGMPAAMCGDSLYYEDETSSAESNKGVIFGSAMQPIDNKKSNYKSTMKKMLLEDIKTVIIEGEKTELVPTMYRYAVTLKMIGDSSEKWKLFLYNSCTGETSLKDSEESEGKLGWYEYGQLGFQQFFGNHYAGGYGNDMIFDCTLGESCRFDQACVEFEGKGTHCVTLVHGGGFSTPGETGSTFC